MVRAKRTWPGPCPGPPASRKWEMVAQPWVAQGGDPGPAGMWEPRRWGRRGSHERGGRDGGVQLPAMHSGLAGWPLERQARSRARGVSLFLLVACSPPSPSRSPGRPGHPGHPVHVAPGHGKGLDAYFKTNTPPLASLEQELLAGIAAFSPAAHS